MLSDALSSIEHVPRPPTPPKDSSNDLNEALEFLNVDYRVAKPSTSPRRATSGTETPPVSSPPASQNDTGHRTIKKVEFLPWTVKHEQSTSKSMDGLRPNLRRIPSQKDPRPLKSILKSTTGQLLTPDESGSPAAGYFSSEIPKDFPKMLESVLKLLGSTSQTQHLDGYRTLTGALKTYEDLPDRQAMKTKMPQLERFITRDITLKSTDARDTVLATQALKLSIALISTPAISSSISDVFQSLLLDKCIETFGQEDIVKAIVSHYMYIMAFQDFSSRIVTNAKAEQIIASLDTINDRVSGNSVIASRLVIYQRLLTQAPVSMLARVRDWLKHIFHGVLSSNKEIRQRALDCGLRAGAELGANHSVTKAILDLFASEVKGSGSYGDYLIARLSDMISNKETSPIAAQIWGMVAPFFQNRKRRISQWHMFRPWLLVIQRCLNSSDPNTKYQATIAWNRLVLSLGLDQSTSNPKDQVVSMLKVPFVVAFDKKEHDKPSRDARRIAQGGYCNLLHYALQPAQTHDNLDMFWDEYVDTVLPKLLTSGGKDARFACKILRALFRGQKTVWDAARAMDPRPVAPEELPRLDCRWLRLRLHKVLQLLMPFFEIYLVSEAISYEVNGSPWTDLMAALAEAGSQEVRASMELREALAHAMNFFGRLWQTAPETTSESMEDVWITRYSSMMLSCIDSLGALHFAEENMSKNHSNTLEPVPTPSHRASKHHDTLQSPLAYVYGLFAHPTVISMTTDTYFEVARKILHNACLGSSSLKARFTLLRHCIPKATNETNEAMQRSVAYKLWNNVVSETVAIIQMDGPNASAHDTLGMQARHVVAVLAGGLTFDNGSTVVTSPAGELYSASLKMLRHGGGDGAVVLGLMEPLASAMLQARPDMKPSSLLAFTTLLLSESVWPRSRQLLEEGRKALSANSLHGNKQNTFVPFDHIYNLINVASATIVTNPTDCQPSFLGFIKSLRDFLSRTPSSLAVTALRNVQNGLSAIVRAASDISGEHKPLIKEILSLWNVVLSSVKNNPPNSRLLEGLEALFIAGLCSTQRSIVNATVITWNAHFGQLETLEYPPEIAAVLRQLREVVELDLPTFPDSKGLPELIVHVPFMTLQEECMSDDEITPKAQNQQREDIRSTPKLAQHGLSFLKPGSTARAADVRRSTTPTPSRRAPAGAVSAKARLRHDDSQIQFVAVESSPVASAEFESQNLTDHQKDVIARQHMENAQMYPDFSSSPVHWPSTPRHHEANVSRLDFGVQRGSTRVERSTPEPTNDDQGAMDDFLGSSPTPRTVEKPRAQPEILNQDHREAEPPIDRDDSPDVDVPSSPPEMEEDDDAEKVQEETEVGIDTTSRSDEQAAVINDEPQRNQQPIDERKKLQDPELQSPTEASSEDADRVGTVTVQRSTTEVPEGNEQKDDPGSQETKNGAQTEPKETSFCDATTGIPTMIEDEENHISSRDSTPIHFEDSNVDESQVITFKGNDATVSLEAVDTDHSPRGPEIAIENQSGDATIEDHYNDQTVLQTQDDSRSTPLRSGRLVNLSQDIDSGSRKRKRATPTPSSQVKRQKRASPIKQLWSRLTGASQEQEKVEEDIPDCIVVNLDGASQDKEEGKEDEKEQEQEQEEEAGEAEISPQKTMEPPKSKRGRGRPRKSVTPVSGSPARFSQTRSGKRRASVLSNTTMDDFYGTPGTKSIVLDTPVPTKTRRQRRSQDVKMAQESQQDDDTAASDSQTRYVNAVVIPTAGVQVEEYEGYGSESVSPEEQLRQEEAAALSQRAIAKPKSIIERLRSIWDDLKNTVMSSQEEREADDILFQIKKEVHEAERRGKTL